MLQKWANICLSTPLFPKKLQNKFVQKFTKFEKMEDQKDKQQPETTKKPENKHVVTAEEFIKALKTPGSVVSYAKSDEKGISRSKKLLEAVNKLSQFSKP